jgi:hypothetical protein
MTVTKINPRTSLLILIIALVASIRVVALFSPNLEPLALFTPIGAMALFGGAYFPGRIKPFAFPLLALFLSDVFLSYTVYASYRVGLLYSGWLWTYLAFGLMTLAGKLIIRKVTVRSVGIASLAAVLIHWLVSDIGGCLAQPGFGAKMAVYFQRLVEAIPFELGLLAGNLIFSAIMFGTVEFSRRSAAWATPA